MNLYNEFLFSLFLETLGYHGLPILLPTTHICSKIFHIHFTFEILYLQVKCHIIVLSSLFVGFHSWHRTSLVFTFFLPPHL